MSRFSSSYYSISIDFLFFNINEPVPNSLLNYYVSYINKLILGIELNKSDKNKILNIELLSEIRTDIVGTKRATKATSENPDIVTSKYK